MSAAAERRRFEHACGSLFRVRAQMRLGVALEQGVGSAAHAVFGAEHHALEPGHRLGAELRAHTIHRPENQRFRAVNLGQGTSCVGFTTVGAAQQAAFEIVDQRAAAFAEIHREPPGIERQMGHPRG